MEYFKGLLNQKPNVNPHFCNSVNKYLEIHDNECDVCQNKKCDLLDDYVTNSEVCNCILDMSSGKAACIDGVLVEMLKSSKHVLVPYMCASFDNILKTGMYPSRWTESVLCPIYKKGFATDPSNYRGILLLTIVGKIFTKLIKNRFVRWEDENGLQYEEQAGYKKGIAQ